MNLPVLLGTPRQVVWAEDIRRRMVSRHKDAIWLARSVRDAGWWIDHRSDDPDRLVSECALVISVTKALHATSSASSDPLMG